MLPSADMSSIFWSSQLVWPEGQSLAITVRLSIMQTKHWLHTSIFDKKRRENSIQNSVYILIGSGTLQQHSLFVNTTHFTQVTLYLILSAISISAREEGYYRRMGGAKLEEKIIFVMKATQQILLKGTSVLAICFLKKNWNFYPPLNIKSVCTEDITLHYLRPLGWMLAPIKLKLLNNSQTVKTFF